MADITVLKRALNGKAREVAEYLLPLGRVDGREWCCGSIHGEAGKSLKVCIAGQKAGVWQDFAAGEGGDLISLWAAVKRMNLVEALDDIRSWLGLEKPQFERRERTYRRPDRPKCEAPSSAVLDYLMGERKLSEEAISTYRIGERGRTIVFPSYLPDGTLAFIKTLGLDRKDGKKQIWAEPDCEPILFGWPAISDDARDVTITEGELDSASMWDYGFPALSVPFGGGKGNKQQWIEAEYERLLRFEVIYLALDGDAEGDLGAEEIANRLGRHRCRRVKLPRKDANQCLQDGVPASQIERCIRSASTLDPPELRRAGEFTDQVTHLFWPAHGEEPGYGTPFSKIGGSLRFRPAEVTIWSGATGAGKSQLLSYASVAWGSYGARVCIASFEMIAPQFLKRMVKQASNIDRPPAQAVAKIMGWFNEWVFVFDAVGKRNIERILEVFEYARARYGCDTFIIDSLMRLGVGSEDYEGQEKAVFEIVNWAVEKQVHIHLVAHARKADREQKGVGDTEDVKGASEITANASNVVIVWRNKKLEDEIRQAHDAIEYGGPVERDLASAKLTQLEDMPPVIMNVSKQRNGDWEGKIGLWFDQETYQYRSRGDPREGRLFLPDDWSAA
jgi:twinkle protein